MPHGKASRKPAALLPWPTPYSAVLKNDQHELPADGRTDGPKDEQMQEIGFYSLVFSLSSLSFPHYFANISHILTHNSYAHPQASSPHSPEIQVKGRRLWTHLLIGQGRERHCKPVLPLEPVRGLPPLRPTTCSLPFPF